MKQIISRISKLVRVENKLFAITKVLNYDLSTHFINVSLLYVN